MRHAARSTRRRRCRSNERWAGEPAPSAPPTGGRPLLGQAAVSTRLFGTVSRRHRMHRRRCAPHSVRRCSIQFNTVCGVAAYNPTQCAALQHTIQHSVRCCCIQSHTVPCRAVRAVRAVQRSAARCLQNLRLLVGRNLVRREACGTRGSVSPPQPRPQRNAKPNRIAAATPWASPSVRRHQRGNRPKWESA